MYFFPVPAAKFVERKYNCSDHVFKIRKCSHWTWLRFRPNIILFPVGRAEVELGNNESARNWMTLLNTAVTPTTRECKRLHELYSNRKDTM